MARTYPRPFHESGYGRLGLKKKKVWKPTETPWEGEKHPESTGRNPFEQPPGRVNRGNPYGDLMADYINGLRADIGAESTADAGGRDAALRKFLISYGAIPDFEKMGLSPDAIGFLKGILDDKTRGLIDKNTAEGLSIKARLDKMNADQQRIIPANLAGRGMLRSGQTGADLNKQAQQNKQSNFDTLNEMIGGIEGTVGSFLANERERQRQLAEAAMQAQMDAMRDWGSDMDYDNPAAPPPANPSNPFVPFAKPKRPGRPNRFIPKHKPGGGNKWRGD